MRKNVDDDSNLEMCDYLKFTIVNNKSLETPIRLDILSIDGLKRHGKTLAKMQLVTDNPAKGYNLSERLKSNKKVLFENYSQINNAINQKQSITPAAEWLVDNFYIVEEQLRDIQEHLPIWFYKELPKLATGILLEGYPRVYGLSWNFIAHSDSRFDPEFLVQFIHSYQDVQALTIGELWAIAITLRIVLVENLRCLSVLVVNSFESRKVADRVVDDLLGADKEAAQRAQDFLQNIGDGEVRESFLVQLLQRLRYIVFH